MNYVRCVKDNSLIFPTTADKFFKISSFRKRTILNPISRKPLSRLPNPKGRFAGGRSQSPLKPNIDLETQPAHEHRKEVNSMPSPFGEGQTDMPINHHPLGEVPLSPPLFPPPFGLTSAVFDRAFTYESTRETHELSSYLAFPVAFIM